MAVFIAPPAPLLFVPAVSLKRICGAPDAPWTDLLPTTADAFDDGAAAAAAATAVVVDDDAEPPPAASAAKAAAVPLPLEAGAGILLI